MPPAIYTQNVIALIWDFDKTLTHGYMQEPLFEEFGIDGPKFWDEVNGLAEYYKAHDCRVSEDTVYLNHILSYVRHGRLPDLTNSKLQEIGSRIELAPGLPDFFERTARLAESKDDYKKHEIRVEHYIVSTGLRRMILGSPIAEFTERIWACDLLPEAAPPEYGMTIPTEEGVLQQVGYTIDNTSKTRAIFEINKGVGLSGDGITVNSLIPEDSRRVPIRNMIYIADGPSDIPSFSVVNAMGGKTLGVYAPGDRNYNNAALLEEQSRVNSIAAASYVEGSPAEKWLFRAVQQIADEIVVSRERAFRSFSSAPGHVVE